MTDDNNTNRRIEELEKELAELKKRQAANNTQQGKAAYKEKQESQAYRKKQIEEQFERAKLKNALDGVEMEDPAEDPENWQRIGNENQHSDYNSFLGIKVVACIVAVILVIVIFVRYCSVQNIKIELSNANTTKYTTTRKPPVYGSANTTKTTPATTEQKVQLYSAKDIYQYYYTNIPESTPLFDLEYYYIRGRIAYKYDDGSFFYFETGLGDSIDKQGQFLVYVNDEFEPQVKDLAIGDYVTIYGRWQLDGYEMIDEKTVPHMTIWYADLEDGELDTNHYEKPNSKIYTPEELYLYFDENHPEGDTAINGSLVCVRGTVIGGEYSSLYLDIGEENYPDWPYENYTNVFYVDFGFFDSTSIAKYHVGDEIVVYGECNAESWMNGVHMVSITTPTVSIVTEVGGEDAAPIEAVDLYEEFRNDQSAAKEKYNKKDVTLRGTVSGLSPTEGIVYINASGDHMITCFVADVSAFAHGEVVDLHGMLKYDGFYTDKQKGFCAMLYLYADGAIQPEPVQ